MPTASVTAPGLPGAPCTRAQGEVSGEVRDGAGQVLPGAQVSVFGSAGRYSAETDSGGAFRVQGLCPGIYQIVAVWISSSGQVYVAHYDADADTRPDTLLIGPDAWRWSDLQVVCPEPAVATPTPAPESCPPGSASGAIGGTVRDSAGVPAAGALLFALPFSDAPAGQVRSAGDGRYLLTALCPDDYLVLGQLDQRGSRLIGAFDRDGDGSPDAVRMQAGARVIEPIDLVLRPERVDPLVFPARWRWMARWWSEAWGH